jgi:fused signal recognition particle receptor
MRIVKGSAKFGPELWEVFEEVLLASDIGVPTMNWIMEELKKKVRESTVVKKEEIVQLLKELLFNTLEEVEVDKIYSLEGPCVVMVIGINGSGKTTTIGKLAARYKREGELVMVAAGDTFRAAATEQLQAWAQRIDIPCVHHKKGTDPSAD